MYPKNLFKTSELQVNPEFLTAAQYKSLLRALDQLSDARINFGVLADKIFGTELSSKNDHLAGMLYDALNHDVGLAIGFMKGLLKRQLVVMDDGKNVCTACDLAEEEERKEADAAKE